MKNSNIYFFGLLLLVFSACSNQDRTAYQDDFNYNQNQEEYYQGETNYNTELVDGGDYNGSQNGYTNQQSQSNTRQNQNSQTSKNNFSRNAKTVMHTIPSAKFSAPFAQIPLPANWKLNTNVKAGEPSITGPNGIKCYEYAGQYFMYSSDQFMQQTYQAAGQQMKRPTGAANVLKSDLTPFLNKEGYTLVKQYSMPKLAQVNRGYDAKLWKSMPSQSKFEVLGSEWTDGKGNTTLIIMNYSENSGQGSTYWGYYMSGIEAPNKVFESAKNAYVNGLENIQHNPQNIQAYNQSEQQKSNAHWAAHNKKMANNQANFNASQKRLNDTYSEISDIYSQGYKDRTAIQDKGHANYINSIREVENVYNGTNGQTYEIESGYNQTWMNNGGEYIQSNDYNYNPNTDPNANQYNWQETQNYPY